MTGITDAEGHFFVNFKKLQGDIRSNITLGFKVSQKEDSGGILFDLQRFFSCGRIVKEREGYMKFEVTKFDEIIYKIIPHFIDFPLQTSKHLNFLDFVKISGIVNLNNHLTIGGYNDILLIYKNMNKGRKFRDK